MIMIYLFQGNAESSLFQKKKKKPIAVRLAEKVSLRSVIILVQIKYFFPHC